MNADGEAPLLDLADFGMEPEWQRAIRHFDNGKAALVVEVLRSGVDISKEVRAFLADVIEGKRRPKKRGKANQKLTPDDYELLRLAAAERDYMQRNIVSRVGEPHRSEIQEQLDVRRDSILQAVAERTGLQRETVADAWQAANRRYAQAAKQRRIMAQRRQAQLRRAAEDAQRRQAQLRDRFKNDPFGGKR